MNNLVSIETYKIKKQSEILDDFCKSTQEGGYVIAEAILELSYKVSQIVSQIKCNERNNIKHRGVNND